MLAKALKILPRAMAGDPFAIAIIIACGIPEVIRMLREKHV